MILLAPDGSARQRISEKFFSRGISADRVEFISRQSRRDYLQTYHRIDLCLDTIPYNGHTTSLDAFWMGVPVLTLIGQTPVGRAGWTELSNLGLPELAAASPTEFTKIAVQLAQDSARLSEIRSTLRDRMRKSPLMDGPGFVRGVEAAYRLFWRRFCQSGHTPLRS